MKIFLLLFLSFFFFSMTSATSFKSLTGNWTNELGSTCHFDAAEDGSVTGTYNTAVGRVHVEHPIYGRWLQGRKHNDTLLVSFVVMWKDTDDEKSRSATVWNGQLFDDPDGGATLTTQWLLVSEKKHQDMWKNTLVRGDTFKRKKD